LQLDPRVRAAYNQGFMRAFRAGLLMGLIAGVGFGTALGGLIHHWLHLQ
jgi:hypothetical protein